MARHIVMCSYKMPFVTVLLKKVFVVVQKPFSHRSRDHFTRRGCEPFYEILPWLFLFCGSQHGERYSIFSCDKKFEISDI